LPFFYFYLSAFAGCDQTHTQTNAAPEIVRSRLWLGA
jgi:hypothetical protein